MWDICEFLLIAIQSIVQGAHSCNRTRGWVLKNRRKKPNLNISLIGKVTDFESDEKVPAPFHDFCLISNFQEFSQNSHRSNMEIFVWSQTATEPSSLNPQLRLEKVFEVFWNTGCIFGVSCWLEVVCGLCFEGKPALFKGVVLLRGNGYPSHKAREGPRQSLYFLLGL